MVSVIHVGEDSEGYSFFGNGHLASFEDHYSEGQDLIIGVFGTSLSSDFDNL